MADFYEEMTDFAGGVRGSVPGAEIPQNALRYGINTAFRFADDKLAFIGKRPGLITVNTTAITGQPNIHWAKRYVYATNGGTVKDKIALITDAGELYYKESDETISAELTKGATWLDADNSQNWSSSGNCFGANPTSKVDGTVIGDRLCLVNAAGDRISLQDGTYSPLGLKVEDLLTNIAVTAVSTGSGTMPDGDYTVYVTVYNPFTGDESNRSDAYSITLSGSQNIQITADYTAFAVSGEGGNYVARVYVQREATQATAYRAMPVYDGALFLPADVDDGELALAQSGGAISATVKLTAAQLADLIIPVPDDGENNVLPDTAKYLATFGQRLIAADQRNIYWSKLNGPAMFPKINTERINTGDGSPIVGLAAHSDDILLILTTTGVFGLFGNDPQSWVLKPITRSCGCVGHQSICTQSPLGTSWWAPELGPVAFDGQQIHFIARDKLGLLDRTTGYLMNVNENYLSEVVSGYDANNYRLLWAVPLNSSTNNNAILSFNAKMMEFEAAYWTTPYVGSFVFGKGSGQFRLYLCGHKGQVFYFDTDTYNDGVPSGTVSGTVTGVTSISSITSTGFYTTGSGLAYRLLTLATSSGKPVGNAVISSNTATTLTLASSITGLTASETYTWYVGAIDFHLYTRWFTVGQPFLRKRVDTVYIGHEQTTMSVNPGTVAVQLSNNDTEELALATVTSWKRRLKLIGNGIKFRIRIFAGEVNKDFVLDKISIMGRMLSDRYQI